MPTEELQRSPMMRHLLEAMERGQDVGHYGRLTFAMVARYFMDDDELVRLLTRGGADEEGAKAMVQQVRERDYNPPSRQTILEWQRQQDFPICPDPDDPNACNVYRELDLPPEVYEEIQEYRAEQFDREERSQS
ncbi:MAG: hypothetical protein IRY97_06635 [Thermomicrobiaceae bacterium]|nr:hypothetical protein [Thermomicrobiaceae bacterium]